MRHVSQGGHAPQPSHALYVRHRLLSGPSRSPPAASQTCRPSAYCSEPHPLARAAGDGRLNTSTVILISIADRSAVDVLGEWARSTRTAPSVMSSVSGRGARGPLRQWCPRWVGEEHADRSVVDVLGERARSTRTAPSVMSSVNGWGVRSVSDVLGEWARSRYAPLLMSSVSGQEHASSPSKSLFFVAFDVVVISSPSTSSFFRRFRHHFFRRFRSRCFVTFDVVVFSPGCPAPDPVSCPELPTSVPIFELLHQIFQLLPRPFSNLPRFLHRSMRPAPTRSRRGLPCFADWHITSKPLSAHSQGAHECVVHNLEVVWVNLEQIPIPLESWPFKFQPCSRLGYLVTYPRPCLTIDHLIYTTPNIDILSMVIYRHIFIYIRFI